jgi:hypothetical protein
VASYLLPRDLAKSGLCAYARARHLVHFLADEEFTKRAILGMAYFRTSERAGTVLPSIPCGVPKKTPQRAVMVWNLAADAVDSPYQF